MSLLGKSQILIWVFYIVMTMLNTPSGVQGRSIRDRWDYSHRMAMIRRQVLDFHRRQILSQFRDKSDRSTRAERLTTPITTSTTVSAVTMSSPPEVYVLDRGESAQLKCEFLANSFNFFDNSVTWIKTQKDKQTQISIMGNLLEPYGVNGRYFLTVTLKQPRYGFTLSILNVSLEDDGNYTCEVRGRRSSATVTHSLFIQAVKMLSPGQRHVLNKGQSVQLKCEFLSHDFNLFDNPVTWIKKQKDKQTQINVMGNILEPYEATRRYLVTFANDQSRYSLTLSIINVSTEDSGSYTCEVGGPGSPVLAAVTHDVVVREVDLSAITAHMLRHGLEEPEESGSGEE